MTERHASYLELHAVAVRINVVELPLEYRLACVCYAVVPQVIVSHELEGAFHNGLERILCQAEVAQACLLGCCHVGISQHHRGCIACGASRVVGLGAILCGVLQVVDDKLPYVLERLTAVAQLVLTAHVDDRNASVEHGQLHHESAAYEACLAVESGYLLVFVKIELSERVYYLAASLTVGQRFSHCSTTYDSSEVSRASYLSSDPRVRRLP